MAHVTWDVLFLQLISMNISSNGKTQRPSLIASRGKNKRVLATGVLFLSTTPRPDTTEHFEYVYGLQENCLLRVWDWLTRWAILNASTIDDICRRRVIIRLYFTLFFSSQRDQVRAFRVWTEKPTKNPFRFPKKKSKCLFGIFDYALKINYVLKSPDNPDNLIKLVLLTIWDAHLGQQVSIFPILLWNWVSWYGYVRASENTEMIEA
jgi:hypothetical protein